MLPVVNVDLIPVVIVSGKLWCGSNHVIKEGFPQIRRPKMSDGSERPYQSVPVRTYSAGQYAVRGRLEFI